MISKIIASFKGAEKQKDKAPSLVNTMIGKFEILMPENHSLPIYLAQHKYYSRNLPRIAAILKEHIDGFSMIDVGANVGDTIALVRSLSNFPILAIEGDENFYEVLNKNKDLFSNVEICRALLGQHDEAIHASVEDNSGTAKIYTGEKNRIEITTLDRIIKMHKSFELSKLLKVDTDGFDVLVMLGGWNFICSQKPVLFFEYHSEYLRQNKTNGVAFLEKLNSIGYDNVIYYDNYGKLLTSFALNKTELIRDLDNYMRGQEKLYYDICVFHENDTLLYEDIISKEKAFFNYD